MNPYDEMLGLLRRYHTEANGDRLAKEMLSLGYNVVTDFIRLKVGLPWVWSDAMGAFYGQTDAFVYEGLAFHYRPDRTSLRDFTAKKIGALLPQGGRVLCYGDGIGFDSCEIARSNPEVKVVSFEPGSASSSFARKLISDNQLSRQVEQLSEPEHLALGTFDVAVCYDVLEHIPDPLGFVEDLAKYLKPDGQALIVEAFEHVDPAHPTHLLSNLRFAGRTVSLFKQAGFKLQGLPGRVHLFKMGAYSSAPPLLWRRLKMQLDGVRARARFRHRYGSPERAYLRAAFSMESPCFLQANLRQGQPDFELFERAAG